MSEFSLINLVGMSVFCVALFTFKFFISFKISSLSTNEKLKRVLELQFSLIAVMLGWTLYLTIAPITGSLMEAYIGSSSLYCGIFRFWIIVEKKLFKTLAVSLSFFKILVLSTSCHFTGHNFVRQQWFNYFPKFFIIAYIFYTQILIYSLLLFPKSVAHKFLCLLKLILFSSLLFLRKIFLSLVLTIIALDKDLFIKGE